MAVLEIEGVGDGINVWLVEVGVKVAGGLKLWIVAAFGAGVAGCPGLSPRVQAVRDSMAANLMINKRPIFN